MYDIDIDLDFHLILMLNMKGNLYFFKCMIAKFISGDPETSVKSGE